MALSILRPGQTQASWNKMVTPPPPTPKVYFAHTLVTWVGLRRDNSYVLYSLGGGTWKVGGRAARTVQGGLCLGVDAGKAQTAGGQDSCCSSGISISRWSLLVASLTQ